jgi:hypothetical protein
MNDADFLEHVADRLRGLDGVVAVTLGGSRAEGTNRPDSDWDFSIYYRGSFDPQSLRDIGWPGTVSDLGGWSSIPDGVFNGGAWLTIDGRTCDVHYRDLDVVERVIALADEGRFTIEPLTFHLAGLPSYIVMAELSTRRVLAGDVPTVTYPDALRASAAQTWWRLAEFEFDYAARYHATAGRLTQCIGETARAVTCAAHATVAARGIWVTNEKQLFARAGFEGVDALLSEMTSDDVALAEAVEAVHAWCRDAVATSAAPGSPA